MICEECGEKMIVKNNPKHGEHETDLIFECENCKNKKEELISEN